MLRLTPVQAEDRTLLWNIQQKYLHEMTQFYDDPMDAEGNYHYGHFEEYFTDPLRRALLIWTGDRLAGFAMVIPYSNIGRPVDHVMAEFTIFPAFRRRGLAREAARRILADNPGRWEIKYNEKNTPAKALWEGVAAPYHPQRYAFSEEETILLFSTEGNDAS